MQTFTGRKEHRTRALAGRGYGAYSQTTLYDPSADRAHARASRSLRAHLWRSVERDLSRASPQYKDRHQKCSDRIVTEPSLKTIPLNSLRQSVCAAICTLGPDEIGRFVAAGASRSVVEVCASTSPGCGLTLCSAMLAAVTDAGQRYSVRHTKAPCSRNKGRRCQAPTRPMPSSSK